MSTDPSSYIYIYSLSRLYHHPNSFSGLFSKSYSSHKVQKCTFTTTAYILIQMIFPVPSIVIVVVTATTFLLVSFYILVIKSCFNWQQVNSSSRLNLYGGQRNEDSLGPHSPTTESRGLEELVVQNIPTLLRVLPSCRHSFHLDCIDIWLQGNDNCPLCRSSISSRIGYPFDQIIAPSSSPEDDPLALLEGEDDFEVTGLQSEDEPRNDFLLS